jgi:hypothetical protein
LSPNKDREHVFVLPEDDANKELANGFRERVDWTRYRRMQVLPPAGGWTKVLERFKSDHVAGMERCPNRFMVLLIDFDGRRDRLEKAKAAIPANLADRVFVLGALSQPEALKAALGLTFENIGSAMADDCREETDTTWGHELLRHNANELERLRQRVRSILFLVPQR